MKKELSKKYEIALLFDSYEYENVETYEYDTIQEMQKDLKCIIEKADDNLYKIELSILRQDEYGENLDTYSFCDIDMKWFSRGEKCIK